MTKTTANSYELLAIFAGSLREGEFKKELEKFEAELTQVSKILNKVIWANRLLAYKIGSETTGNYFVAHFEAEGEEINKLDNSLRLDPKIIRHLICKTPKNYKWREYTEEDLEHDHTKLERTEPAVEPRFVKKGPAGKRPVTAKKKIEKEIEPQADAGEIDKQLDDILADL